MKSGKEKKKTPTVQIDQKWCKGCYICLEACPKKVFGEDAEVNAKGFKPVVVVRPGECTGCLQCEMLCPDLAIKIEQS